VIVEPMTPADVSAVHQLEKQSFTSTWQDEAFANELRNNPTAHYLVLRTEPGGPLRGYAGFWLVEDEAHITSIAISKELRNQGAGKRLLLSLLCLARRLGGRWTTLEVRYDNAPALALYKRFGFARVGVRKRYYDGQHDAVIMWAGNLQSQLFTQRLVSIGSKWPEAIEELAVA
jgi:ribosomal-protein-alanine N-acetyltransferase